MVVGEEANVSHSDGDGSQRKRVVTEPGTLEEDQTAVVRTLSWWRSIVVGRGR